MYQCCFFSFGQLGISSRLARKKLGTTTQFFQVASLTFGTIGVVVGTSAVEVIFHEFRVSSNFDMDFESLISRDLLRRFGRQ